MTPKPPRPGGPPIWLGGFVEPAIRRAVEIADGWLGGGTFADFEEGMGWVNDEVQARGRAGFGVGGYWAVFTWDGPDAWERLRPHLHYSDWKYEDAEGSRGRLGPLPPAPGLDAEGEAALREGVICGTPDEVAEGIRHLRDIGGEETHVVCRSYFPGMDRATMRSSMRLFAEEVAPRFR